MTGRLWRNIRRRVPVQRGRDVNWRCGVSARERPRRRKQGEGPRPVQIADEELARRAARGDTRAFEDLVERHQRYVFNLCLRIMGDYDLAAEMAQETFLRAW